ncbi:MAG: hypothetical protein QOF30_2730 [Acidimicrobiaceae bacterium]|jgi:hypothetical protein|nr:hypothetical protein [Acidimicrobiaceae bacterium]
MARSRATKKPALSPLGALARGAIAGAVGTVALDAANYAQYRAGGGQLKALQWEFAEGLDSWDDAPAPAQVGKRLYEGLFQKELPPSSARLVNNVTHWAYGTLWGAQYGVVAASTRPRRLQGPLFGTLVWLSGYVVLPLAKLYEPIWNYDGKTLAKDWSGHLAYGTTTAAAFRLLSMGGN